MARWRGVLLFGSPSTCALRGERVQLPRLRWSRLGKAVPLNKRAFLTAPCEPGLSSFSVAATSTVGMEVNPHILAAVPRACQVDSRISNSYDPMQTALGQAFLPISSNAN